MTDFPTLVYRTPGPHGAPGGATFDYVSADDEEALVARILEGWHLTLPEALAPPESGPRGDLEAEAKPLGIGFNSRTSDETLADKIAAAKVAE